MQLYMSDAGRGKVPVAATRELNGRKLSRRLKRLTASHRALLALELEIGNARLVCPTRAQARALTGASLGYVITARRLTPAERQLVERGVTSLNSFHNRPPS